MRLVRARRHEQHCVDATGAQCFDRLLAARLNDDGAARAAAVGRRHAVGLEQA